MGRTEQALEDFTHGYAHAILWANTTDEAGGEVYPEAWQTPARGWQLGAFTDEARAEVESDARDFFAAKLRDLIEYVRHDREAWRFGGLQGEAASWACAGHDFALTRNGHGAGFWDRGMGELGERLTDAAHAYGEAVYFVNLSDDAALVELS